MGWEGDITNQPERGGGRTGAVIIHFPWGDFQDAVKNGVTVGVGEILEVVTPRQAQLLTAAAARGLGKPPGLEWSRTNWDG